MNGRSDKPGFGRGGTAVLAGALLAGAAILGWIARDGPDAEDRAVAAGLLLDSAPSREAIDRGLVVAEALRRRYGLASGDALRDREEAVRRAERDLLERIAFTDQEVREMAASLGYSLELAACGTTCGNLRNLAILELKKRALEAFAEGRPGPGHQESQAADR